ncbi:class I SAM-dependent methyltransferase [Variovorax sp. PCZ-1]|uniref:methyltransferase regulatory domain-containing protein n=1 Tax=Variovorax sp. PCZ-1 TaxID=2835533 RepID=UPI001BCEF534|nr:class I SAM-dependent methyltransferase [Variovorax sp. PCZ-1]MBS7808538.1 methyltransferase regulatory domain-containing protein [Variovorax sp. PCZ-1]
MSALPPVATSVAVQTGTQIGANADNQAIADAYDSVPYQSKPFAQSAPEQLAVMATLFGLTPPDFRNARVLELGCSAGGNLIPLAAKYPGVKAVGLDISKVEIEHGQEVIKKAGINNCELKALDIVKAQAEIKGQFDYIICHGVFSWVPEPVRHAILDVIRDHLSPTGVAYVSYNVYPGWKTREVIREMMMFHANGRATPAEKLQQAKAILEYTKNLSAEQSTYGKLLRDEAAQVGRAEDYYLYHEYLEIENNPMYFRDFISLAGARKLAYLGEAGLSDMAPQRLGKEVHDTLGMLSGGNILATEQYMDFFTNRTFRQTLLVHEAQTAKINRGLSPQSMRAFAVSTTLFPDPEFKPMAGQLPLAQYKDNFGRSLGVNSALSLALIKVLVEAKPGSMAFGKMVQKLKATVAGLAANSDEAINDAIGMELMNLLVQNVIKLSLEETVTPAISAQPKAYRLALAQAELGQNWATNLLHQPVSISPAHRSVLALLDGTRDQAALQAELLAQLKDGRLTANRGQERITAEPELAQLSRQFCAQALHDLQQMMVLVA